jgi:quinol monooxygenase YgiN
MQRLTLVRYTTKPGAAAENERLARAVFAELRADGPAHVAYALFRDGDAFTHLFLNAETADSSALTELPAFKAYLADLPPRCVAPPERIRLDARLLDAYGLTDAMAPA